MNASVEPSTAAVSTQVLRAAHAGTAGAALIDASAHGSGLGVLTRASVACQPLERCAAQAHGGPFVQRHGAEAAVEADRRLVPVEHRPVEPPAAALERGAC